MLVSFHSSPFDLKRAVFFTSALCWTQIDAIRRGLLSVIPEAVLRLLTWQELERRVCGDPEISLESLSKCSTYSVAGETLV